jgi:transposase
MKARPPGPSKLDPFRNHVRDRLAAGVENCVVLLRKPRAQGYTGGYSILKDYVRPLRLLRREGDDAIRAEARGAGASGLRSLRFVTSTGQRQWLRGFVMVLAWSRLLYVEFVRRADVAVTDRETRRNSAPRLTGRV